MKQTAKIGFARVILLALPLVACIVQTEQDIQEEIENEIRLVGTVERWATIDAEAATAVEATVRARRLGGGVTFLCVAPENSYVHRRLGNDLAYEESWDYTIHINADNDTFQLDHEAYSNRRLEGGLCDDIFVWHAQQSGEVDEEHRLDTTITLNQRNTFRCDADEVHPASEETREDVFQWWLISSRPFYDNGWKISTCTCNADAHQLTPEDIEEFQRTGACPPCVPGAMLCVSVQ